MQKYNFKVPRRNDRKNHTEGIHAVRPVINFPSCQFSGALFSFRDLEGVLSLSFRDLEGVLGLSFRDLEWVLGLRSRELERV